MIPNTNDSSATPPRLRCYFNLMALEGLPDAGFETICAAGYEGVQFVEVLEELRSQGAVAEESFGLPAFTPPASAAG